MLCTAALISDASSNLLPARIQMAVSLGWHIVVACLGVGMPLLLLTAEWKGNHGNIAARLLVRQWSKVAGVLFAVGAVSGTILSFEMGILWSGLMNTFGEVFGLPFALEGIAFFIEAIFMGVYLYTWDRLSPRAHFLSGIPIAVAGIASAFFVVSANAWMNEPRGFTLVNGHLSNPDPWAGMFNPATPIEAAHMILAALMVSGFLTASVYAVAWLRGRRDSYHRCGILIPFVLAAVMTPVQVVVGDMAARFVAEHQPAKLAAMEAQLTTESGAAEHIGGVVIDGQLRYAIRVPHLLSLLISGDPNAQVEGMDRVPSDQQPPINVVHLAFDCMVGIGTFLVALCTWFAGTWLRKRRLPRGRLFFYGAVAAGPASVIAMEAGWVTTEVGRQPWIVYEVMRTADAVNPAPGIAFGLAALCVVYFALTVTTIYVIRRLVNPPQAEKV